MNATSRVRLEARAVTPVWASARWRSWPSRSSSASSRADRPRCRRRPGVRRGAAPLAQAPRRSRRPRRRSCGRSACCELCSRRWSAACSRSRPRRTRASSATRSPIRTSSALRRRGPGRDDRDRLPAGGPPRQRPRRSRRSSAARRRSSRTRSGAPRGGSGTRRRSSSRAYRGRLLHRLADLRPAAERGDAAAGLLVDPREHPEHRLVGRRPDHPYVVVASVVILALRRVVTSSRWGRRGRQPGWVGRVRLALVVAATLGTAAAVAVTGLIGFVGIIVPQRSGSSPGSATGRSCRSP